MARVTNNPINYFDAQYMVDNEGFTALQTITESNKCLTRAEIELYLNANSSNFSGYASNQLVPYQLLIPLANDPGDTTAPVFFSNGFNSGVYISDESESTLLCHWAVSDNVGVSTHRIYWRVSGGSYTSKLVEPIFADNQYNYVLTGLNPSTTYEVYVNVCDATGNCTSSTSYSRSTSAGDTTAPVFTTQLSASQPKSSSIHFSWVSTDNIGVVSQVFYFKEIFNPNYTAITLTSNATSYTKTGLASNTTYYFYVEARDAANNITASDIVTRTTN